ASAAKQPEMLFGHALDYIDGPTLWRWVQDFDHALKQPSLLLLNETLWSLLGRDKPPLPSLSNVRIRHIPSIYSPLLPMDSGIAREFKLRYHTLLFNALCVQQSYPLTLVDLLSFIPKSWVQIPYYIIEKHSQALLAVAGFPQSNQPRSVSEMESKYTEKGLRNILESVIPKIPQSVISYYLNQDKNTGPIRFMNEYIENLRREINEDMQESRSKNPK
ncbi:hypothetical protein BGX27_001620, partial [Mortierella sp. AM989]